MPQFDRRFQFKVNGSSDVPRDSDYLSKAIKARLEPLFSAHGFARVRNKSFARIRGCYIDRVDFELNHRGSKNFYLFVSVYLLFDPSPVDGRLSALSIDRLHEDSNGSIIWSAADETSAKTAVDGIALDAEGLIFSRLDKFQDERDATIELLLDKDGLEENRLRLACLLAKLSRYPQMKNFAGPVMRSKASDDDDATFIEQQADCAYQLIKAARTGQLEDFLAQLAQRNRRLCGLPT